MKRKLKVCSVLIAATMAICSFSLCEKKVFADSSVSNYEDLPDSVDLSKSPYFPEVGDQGNTDSCWYYGNLYMSLTYANNKARGIKATKENTLNPLFGYVYCRGCNNMSMFNFISQMGYPTIGALPIDLNNKTSLYPTAEVWESAARNRGGEMQSFVFYGNEDNIITGPDDSTLNVIKKKLNDGDLMTLNSYSYNWNYSVVASGEHKGEMAIDRCDLNKQGGHCITFCGYDDNIWIDINHDGVQQKAELGAFKMVNSWGKDWGNDGFMWVAYDSLNAKSQVITDSDAVRINNAIAAGTIKANKVNNSVRISFSNLDIWYTPVAMEKSSSECLVYMTVNTGSRKEMLMTVTATSKKDGTVKKFTMANMGMEANNLAWDGSVYSTDGTMVFDLENVVPGLTPETMEDYNWQATFEDTILDEYALTVKDVFFKVNGTKKYITSVSKIALNGTKKTYDMKLKTSSYVEDASIKKENETNIIIYYDNSNYKDANIHYRLGNGTWTAAPGIQMCVDNSQSGYKWKFVINMGSNSNITACFNDRNGSWDNNNKSDYVISAPGCYGIKDGKIVQLKEVENTTIELDKTGVSITAGDKVTVNANIWPEDTANKTITWTTADKSVATVSGGVITGVAAGKTTITATLANGTKATVEVTVKASPVKELKGTIAASKTKVTSGDSITFTTTATGGTGAYKYSLIVHNKTTNKWSRITNNSTSNKYTWEAGSAGTRIFYVDVTDASGKTVRSAGITVTTAAKELKVTSSASSTKVVVGDKVKLTATATGGTGSYKYSYIVHNKTTNEWARIKDKSTSNTFTWEAGSAGTRVFYIDVTDTSGKTVRTTGITVVTEKAKELKVTGTASVKSLSVGGKTVISATNVSGGVGPYTYSYVVKNMATGEWYRFSFRNSKTLTWEATSKGTRMFYVEVKDAKGNVVRSEGVKVTVK